MPRRLKKNNAAPIPKNRPFPQHLKKEGMIYSRGLVTHTAKGISHVTIEINQMKVLTTHRKLESHFRINIITGDQVMVELDPLNFSSTETLRGRLVWRY